MAGRGKKNSNKPNKTADKNKINHLEQKETTKIVDNNSDEDNDSVNINQIEPKKLKTN
jgi:hypothetical protein